MKSNFCRLNHEDGILLWLPPCFVQLLVGIEGKSKIVRLGVRNRFAGIYDLTDDGEIIFLRFVVYSAAARERRYDIVVKPVGLLA